MTTYRVTWTFPRTGESMTADRPFTWAEVEHELSFDDGERITTYAPYREIGDWQRGPRKSPEGPVTPAEGERIRAGERIPLSHDHDDQYP